MMVFLFAEVADKTAVILTLFVLIVLIQPPGSPLNLSGPGAQKGHSFLCGFLISACDSPCKFFTVLVLAQGGEEQLSRPSSPRHP